MKTHRLMALLSIALVVALAPCTTVAQTPAAKAPPSATPAAGAVGSGQAAGTFTAKGKTFKLAHAAVFVDQSDKGKRVMLLLTEQPVPAANWKSRSDISSYRTDKTPLIGVVFGLDDKREPITAEYYAGGDYPTSTSGMFDVTFDAPSGKTFAGSAKSTATAGKMSEPVNLSVTFNAALK